MSTANCRTRFAENEWICFVLQEGPPRVRLGALDVRILLTLKIAVDRGRVLMPPPTFRLSPSSPPVWVKSIRTSPPKLTRCAPPADMTRFVRLSGDERSEGKTRPVHEHLRRTRTQGSEFRSQHPPFFTSFHPYVDVID